MKRCNSCGGEHMTQEAEALCAEVVSLRAEVAALRQGCLCKSVTAMKGAGVEISGDLITYHGKIELETFTPLPLGGDNQ